MDIFRQHNDIDYNILRIMDDEDLYHTCHTDKSIFSFCQYHIDLKNRINNYYDKFVKIELIIDQFYHRPHHIFINTRLPIYINVEKVLAFHHSYIIRREYNQLVYAIDFRPGKGSRNDILNSIKDLILTNQPFNPEKIHLESGPYGRLNIHYN